MSYNDGTSVSANGDGATVTTTPDGSQHTSTPRTIGTGFATPATTVDGESVYVLSNGEHVAAGDGVRVNRDGSLTGSDGTHIFVDPTTNETVVLNPDGTERSRERGGHQNVRVRNQVAVNPVALIMMTTTMMMKITKMVKAIMGMMGMMAKIAKMEKTKMMQMMKAIATQQTRVLDYPMQAANLKARQLQMTL